MNTSDFTENRFLKLIDNIDQRGTSQSNGVPFSPFRPFEDLSMKERAAVIRIGVQNGLRDLESIRSKYNEFAEGGDTNGPRFQQSQEAYYDRDTDTVYAPDSIGEFYRHELFHARPDSVELERLKPYYDNLDDNRLLELGADLPFVKRMDNDPGHFYSPEEIGARVSAARYMLNNAGVNNVDNVFLEEARRNENAYGNNFRDLLHMYNNENLIGIFGNGYSSGGKIHIKKENRGKFTALKERTGHSASWFKAHGTPAQKKMATFALNSRHWKHGDGGRLFYDGGTQESDATRVDLGIVPNLPMGNNAESKFYRDLAMLSAMTDEERKTEDFYNRAHDTGTVAPTDAQARRGWMEVNPISGEAEYHAPTTVSAAPLTEEQRMWQSPAFQLALAPMFDAPFMLSNAGKVAKTAQAAVTPNQNILVSAADDAFRDTDEFIELLKSKTGKNVTRKPISEVPSRSDIYTHGYSYVDDEGNEIAHIFGNKQRGNVYVEDSFVSPDYRSSGIGKKMYFDFNKKVYDELGRPLRSSPFQHQFTMKDPETGRLISPSSRLWKGLKDKGMARTIGSGFNWEYVMEPPSVIESRLNPTRIILEEPAAKLRRTQSMIMNYYNNAQSNIFNNALNYVNNLDNTKFYSKLNDTGINDYILNTKFTKKYGGPLVEMAMGGRLKYKNKKSKDN